jgi:hypothetical protein
MESKAPGRRRSACANLGLQLGKLGIAHLKKAARLLQLGLKLMHSSLEACICAGRARLSSRLRRLVRRDEVQLPRLRWRGLRPRRRTVPGCVLAAYFAQRIARRDGRSRRRVRNTQHRPGVHQIHVAFEGARIRLIHGDHPAARAGRAGR